MTRKTCFAVAGLMHMEVQKGKAQKIKTQKSGENRFSGA